MAEVLSEILRHLALIISGLALVLSAIMVRLTNKRLDEDRKDRSEKERKSQPAMRMIVLSFYRHEGETVVLRVSFFNESALGDGVRSIEVVFGGTTVRFQGAIVHSMGVPRSATDSFNTWQDRLPFRAGSMQPETVSLWGYFKLDGMTARPMPEFTCSVIAVTERGQTLKELAKLSPHRPG